MSWRARPTGFGLVVAVVLVAAVVLGGGGTDPQVGGLVWTALAAVTVAGVVWPIFVVTTGRVTLSARTRDLTAGEVALIEAKIVAVGGQVEVSLDLGRVAQRRWWSVSGRVPVVLDPVTQRRGVVHNIGVEIRSSGPVGVLRASRRRTVAMSTPIWVAPAPVEQRWEVAASERRATEGTARLPSLSGDLVRSVRPYVIGDPAHLVHWPTSARSGELVVRELEPPGDLLIAVVVQLAGTDDDDEVAGSAAGLVEAISEAGGSIVLCTCSPSGPQSTPIESRLHAGRVLAEAVAGPPGAPPPGATVVYVGGATP